MFNKKLKRFIGYGLIASTLLTSSVKAEEPIHYECNTPYEIEVTAYCDSENLTATGCKVREGIAAFAPEYYGMVALLYIDNEFQGYYEIKDTGSYESGVREGKVLDIWLPTKEECREFGRKKATIILVDGKG